DLWRSPIPGAWQRGEDPQLLKNRYRRGNLTKALIGEHLIEREILCEFFPEVVALGGKQIDGINAMPLSTDIGGERKANVEADLYLLVGEGGSYRLILGEVKTTDEHAWFATVENLRQLRLMLDSAEAQRLFRRRMPELSLPQTLPVTGIV